MALIVTKNAPIVHSNLPSGSSIQVVSSEHSGADGNDTFTTSTSFGDSGHSLTITPKFTTSKVLINLLAGRMTYAAAGGIHIRIMASINGGSFSQILEVVDAMTQVSTYGMNMAGQTLHSPNTTGAVIYKTQFKSSNGNQLYYTSSACVVTLTATEIAG